MANPDIARQRLYNQQLTRPTFTQPSEVIRWLGAVQSQDYGAGKWALGLRLRGAADDAIEQAFNDGAILRTHVMRPTWHFVLPEDIRWMLELTAPRVHALSTTYYRRLGLDDTLFARSVDVMIQALEGGRQLTRAELVEALEQAGISGENLRLTYVIFHAELDAVLCSGARRGKQFTYALLDERAPQAKRLPRDEALAELTRRYFTSHGPATLKDYVWWSGLSSADAKTGLEMVRPQLVNKAIDGDTYWLAESAPAATAATPMAYLLPNFDEYMVGYANRSAAFDAQHVELLDARRSAMLDYNVVVDGQIVGTWKRTLKKEAVRVEMTPFIPLSEEQREAIAAAAQRYGEFLGLRVVLSA